jgi:hypothetical protein
MPDLLITDIDDELARHMEGEAAKAGISLEDWCREALRTWARADEMAELERASAMAPNLKQRGDK